MNESKQGRRPGKLRTLLLSLMTLKQLAVIAVTAAIVAAIFWGVGSVSSSENQTTRLGFEDMGELATQTAYCTQVSVTEASRELFGVTIPFTQSKYIYSYDVIIKAGFDFQEITYTVDQESKTITVQLPQAKILSSEVDLDSFQVYHEAESIFRPITLEENNRAIADLQRTAEENAVANGLLEEARANGEAILTGFFHQAYDPAEYAITYVEK